MGKKKNKSGGLVYSTNPDYTPEGEDERAFTPPPSEQQLYVRRDKKARKGKEVTLVEGFEGSAEDLSDLGRWLKTSCGSGGSAKNACILIQGDFRDRVAGLLRSKGYGVKMIGG